MKAEAEERRKESELTTWKAEQRAKQAEERLKRVIMHAKEKDEELQRVATRANQAEKEAIQLQTQLAQSSDDNQAVNNIPLRPHGPDVANHDDDRMNPPSSTSGDEADENDREYGADEDKMDTGDREQVVSRRTIDNDEDEEIYNQESDGGYPSQRQPIPKPSKFQRPSGGQGRVLGASLPGNNVTSTVEPSYSLIVSIC